MPNDEADLRARLEDALSLLTTLKMRLGEMRRHTASEGEYADRDEYEQLVRRVSQQGALCQRLQFALGDAKRARNQHATTTWERAFVMVARRRLLPEVFRGLVEEVDVEAGRAPPIGGDKGHADDSERAPPVEVRRQLPG